MKVRDPILRAGDLEFYRARRTVRVLAVLAVLLALGAVAEAWFWKKAHDEAACWRRLIEDGDWPPEGDCRRI